MASRSSSEVREKRADAASAAPLGFRKQLPAPPNRMKLTTLDWLIVAAFFLIYLGIGVVAARRARGGFSEFFLSGQRMPWWLLGFSMVATTFATDTPNLVTNIVRTSGVSGNWVWWAFLLSGTVTVFFYAKLWRRSGVLTDIEFNELRYSGNCATPATARPPSAASGPSTSASSSTS